MLSRYKHISWSLLDQSLVSGVNFLTGIVLARHLGLQAYGTFALAWLVVQLAASVQEAIITAPLLSILPKAGNLMREYAGAVVIQQFLYLIVSCVFLIVGLEIASIFYPEWEVESIKWLLLLNFSAFQLQNFLRRFLFALGKPEIAFLSDVMSYGGQLLCLLCVFIFYSANLNLALYIMGLTSLLGIIPAIAISKILSLPSSGYFLEVLIRHWLFSKWMLMSEILKWISTNTLMVATGGILGAVYVGAVRSAQNVLGLIQIIFQGLENSIPREAAIRLHEVGTEKMDAYISTANKYIVGSSALVAAIAFVWSDFWMGLLYGAQFEEYGYIVRMHALVYLLLSMSIAARAGLRAFEETKPFFQANILMAAFSLLTSAWLIKSFAISGLFVGLFVMNLIYSYVVTSSYQKLYANKTKFA